MDSARGKIARAPFILCHHITTQPAPDTAMGNRGVFCSCAAAEEDSSPHLRSASLHRDGSAGSSGIPILPPPRTVMRKRSGSPRSVVWTSMLEPPSPVTLASEAVARTSPIAAPMSSGLSQLLKSPPSAIDTHTPPVPSENREQQLGSDGLRLTSHEGDSSEYHEVGSGSAQQRNSWYRIFGRQANSADNSSPTFHISSLIPPPHDMSPIVGTDS